jgi:hypothetical protein
VEGVESDSSLFDIRELLADVYDEIAPAPQPAATQKAAPQPAAPQQVAPQKAAPQPAAPQPPSARVPALPRPAAAADSGSRTYTFATFAPASDAPPKAGIPVECSFRFAFTTPDLARGGLDVLRKDVRSVLRGKKILPGLVRGVKVAVLEFRAVLTPAELHGVARSIISAGGEMSGFRCDDAAVSEWLRRKLPAPKGI